MHRASRLAGAAAFDLTATDDDWSDVKVRSAKRPRVAAQGKARPRGGGELAAAQRGFVTVVADDEDEDEDQHEDEDEVVDIGRTNARPNSRPLPPPPNAPPPRLVVDADSSDEDLELHIK